MTCYAAGKDFRSLSLADWRGYHELFDDGVFEGGHARSGRRRPQTPQSTHPDAVAAALAETKEWLANDSRQSFHMKK